MTPETRKTLIVAQSANFLAANLVCATIANPTVPLPIKTIMGLAGAYVTSSTIKGCCKTVLDEIKIYGYPPEGDPEDLSERF